MITNTFYITKKGDFKKAGNKTEKFIRFINEIEKKDISIFKDVENILKKQRVEINKTIYSNELASSITKNLSVTWRNKVFMIFNKFDGDKDRFLHSIVGYVLKEYIDKIPKYSFDAIKVSTENSGYYIYNKINICKKV